MRARVVSQRKSGPTKEQSSEKTILSFVPGTIVGVAGTGSRVEMNAKNGALDPVPATRGIPCLEMQKSTLTGTDAVIHGLSSVSLVQIKFFHMPALYRIRARL